MIGRLMTSDEVNGALVVALSGAIAVLVAKGPGRASFGRLLAGCLSNPIPLRESSSDVLAPAGERRAAA
ncbi:MAG: hypothetical protein M3151_13245 [Actinomycetota bacterium]|nr:hypothetical protein [Actinomycetota bacterium]